MLGLRERFVRDWPGPAPPADADPAVHRGWRAAALDVAVQAVAGGRARARGAGVVRGARHRPARSSPPTCASARPPTRPTAGDRRPDPAARCRRARSMDHATLPEALLLDAACGRSRGSAGRRRGSAPRSTGGSSAARRARAACSRPTTSSTSPRRSSPATPAGWNGCGRRSSRSRFADRRAVVRRARVPVAGRRVRRRAGGSTRSTASPTGLGGRRLEDGSRRRRPAAARALRARVRRDLAQGARGPDAHLLLPRARRGGVAADGRPRRRCALASRRRSRRSAPARSSRRPGAWCTLLRLQGVLRRRAAPGSPTTPSGAARASSRSSCSSNGRYPAAGSNPPTAAPGHEARREPGLRVGTAPRHRAEPFEVSRAAPPRGPTCRADGTTGRRRPAAVRRKAWRERRRGSARPRT